MYGNTNEIPLDEPVQIWSWTYDESGPQFYGCLIQYGLENISNNEVVTVYEGCLDEDPLFVDPGNEDFHLTANSPCINAGYTMAPDMGYDLDGNWRVCGERIDIGAYEYVSTLGLTNIQVSEYRKTLKTRILSTLLATRLLPQAMLNLRQKRTAI